MRYDKFTFSSKSKTMRRNDDDDEEDYILCVSTIVEFNLLIWQKHHGNCCYRRVEYHHTVGGTLALQC